jgi:hypothetical protein
VNEIIIGDRSAGVIVSVPDKESDAEGWVHATVSLELGAWKGRYAAQFHIDDFSHFASGVAALSSSLEGEALLSSMDGYLEVRLTGDGKGHVEVKGEAWDRPRWGTHLEFEFAIDQTYLSAILTSTNAISQHLAGRSRGFQPLA